MGRFRNDATDHQRAPPRMGGMSSSVTSQPQQHYGRRSSIGDVHDSSSGSAETDQRFGRNNSLGIYAVNNTSDVDNSNAESYNRNGSGQNSNPRNIPNNNSKQVQRMSSMQYDTNNPSWFSEVTTSQPRRKSEPLYMQQRFRSADDDNDGAFRNDTIGGGIFDQSYCGGESSVMSQLPPPPNRSSIRRPSTHSYQEPKRHSIDNHSCSYVQRGESTQYYDEFETRSSYQQPTHSAQEYVPTNNNPSWLGNNSNDGQTTNYDDDDDDDRTMARKSEPFHFDDDATMKTMATTATKKYAQQPSTMKAKGMSVPEGDVTIVYTDIQGSTSLWEMCPSAMKEAQDIHDIIMRQCYTDHQGYEITTEGDAFNLAFQNPVDALAFALQAQLKLYKAKWPEGILKHPDAKDEPMMKLRGFRVRIGLHHGPTTCRMHESTGRIVYSGDGVKIAKAVEEMCHGGQILTTMETWKAVSGMAERYLGRPQIMDCGEHLLFETKAPDDGSNGLTTKRVSKRIMQLVPNELAFDFFAARGRHDDPSEDGQSVASAQSTIKDASAVQGRLFFPLQSKRQLTTSFLNAPYAKGRVTICFVYTVGLGSDDSSLNKAANLAVLAKYVRKQLVVLNPPGYECQEDNGRWMLAFARMAHAVTFGLQLKSCLHEVSSLLGNVDRENMFKVGILSGPFTAMGVSVNQVYACVPDVVALV